MLGSMRCESIPGNIGSEERIRKVLSAAKEQGIPIRIGINGGSLEKDLLGKVWTDSRSFGGKCPQTSGDF